MTLARTIIELRSALKEAEQEFEKLTNAYAIVSQQGASASREAKDEVNDLKKELRSTFKLCYDLLGSKYNSEQK